MVRIEIQFSPDNESLARELASALISAALDCDAIKIHDEPPFRLVVTFLESTQCTADFIRLAHKSPAVERMKTYSI